MKPGAPTTFRRPVWPLVVIPFALVALTLPCTAFAAGLSFFFSDGYWRIASAIEWLWTALFAFGLWCWLVAAWGTIKLFLRYRSPLAVVRAEGIELPHIIPAFVAWSEVAAVDQVRIGAWTNLRLKLVRPERHLSTFRRKWQWPYGDSILVRIEMDAVNVPTPLLEAARIAHGHSVA